MTPTRSARLAHLDGVRAVAALYVLVHHTWLTVFPHGMADLHGALKLGAVLNYGHIAVAGFIVVSGYSLTLGALRHDGALPHGAGAFFARRFWRIVPTYWAALGLSIAAGLTVLSERTTGPWAQVVPFDLSDVAAHFLLVQNFWHPYAINHVMWSIATEWQIYFLFPVVLLAARRLRTPALAALVLATFALGAAADAFAVEALSNIDLIGCFCLGVAACRIAHRMTERPLPAGATRSACLPVAAAAGIGAALSLLAGLPIALSDCLAGVGLSTLLVALATGRAPGLQRALSARVLTAIGLFSYSLYLIHPLAVQGAWLVVRTVPTTPAGHVGLLAVMAIPWALAVSWLFFLVAERPFLQGRRPTAWSSKGKVRTPEPPVTTPIYVIKGPDAEVVSSGHSRHRVPAGTHLHSDGTRHPVRGLAERRQATPDLR